MKLNETLCQLSDALCLKNYTEDTKKPQRTTKKIN